MSEEAFIKVIDVVQGSHPDITRISIQDIKKLMEESVKAYQDKIRGLMS